MGLQAHAAEKSEMMSPELAAQKEKEQATQVAPPAGEEQKKDQDPQKAGAAKIVADLVAAHGPNPPLDLMVEAYQSAAASEQAEFDEAVEEQCGNQYALALHDALGGAAGDAVQAAEVVEEKQAPVQESAAQALETQQQKLEAQLEFLALDLAEETLGQDAEAQLQEWLAATDQARLDLVAKIAELEGGANGAGPELDEALESARGLVLGSEGAPPASVAATVKLSFGKGIVEFEFEPGSLDSLVADLQEAFESAKQAGEAEKKEPGPVAA